ncbi:SUPT20H isoform 6, partial [Pongo abelii]
SNWFIIGSKTDAERVVNQYQELVQNEAKCPVKMSHSSSGSASLSQVSPGKETEQTETVSVQSSVLGKGVKHRPPPIKLPSSSGNSSSGNYFTPQQTSSFLKSPTPPPSSKPPTIPRKSSVDLNQVSMLSPAALSPASSSQRTTATQVMANSAGLNFINVVGSVCGAQALMSGSNPMLGCNTGAITPAGINLSGLLPSGGLLPNALPSAMQAASQAGVPFGLKNTSSLRPLNLLQQQQQQLSQFTPQQPQQPTTSSPQQPGEQGSEQGSTSQEQALSAQQAAVINLTGVGSFMQSQAAVLSQLGSAENRPEQSLPQQRFQLSSAFQQQQQQIQQLRFLQHQMAMAAAAAQTAQLHHHRHTGSQSKSKMKRGTPTTPKF